MIKNIIFDLGMVLLDYTPENYLKKCNLSDEEISLYLEMIFGSPEWHQCDRGDFTYEEMIDVLCAKFPEHSEKIRRILDKNNYDNSSVLSEFPGSYEFVESLKNRGYKIYFLSNVNDWMIECDKKSFRVFNLIEGGVYSCEEKCAKPDIKIYQTILERYGLKAEECVFIDDKLSNVKAAEMVGIKGIEHTSIADTAQVLDKMIEQG